MSAQILNFMSPAERLAERYCEFLALDGRYKPEEFRAMVSHSMSRMTLDAVRAELDERIERERLNLQRQLDQLAQL